MTKYRVEQSKRTQATTLRHALTEAEIYLWQLLRSRQISDLKFRRQVPVGPWIAGFVCFEHMLIVEADGSQYGENLHDEIRDTDLRRRGFRILRFWNNDILVNPNGVLERILSETEGPPHPAAFGRDPLPQGGAG